MNLLGLAVLALCLAAFVVGYGPAVALRVAEWVRAAIRLAAQLAFNLLECARNVVRGIVGLGVAMIGRMFGAAPGAFALLRFGLKLGAMLTPAGIFLFLTICAITNPYVSEGLAYAHQRSSGVEVLDADGHWLGIITPASFADWSDGKRLPADHAAIVLPAVPRIWRQCLIQLEDRSALAGVSRRFGIDPLALIKSGMLTVLQQRRRGASTLHMQLVRMLNGESPDPNQAIGPVVLRKIAEIVGANALVNMFDAGDPRAPERYLSMHLPLLIGAAHSGFGQPIYGVGLAARILFSKPAESLSIEEQAILAAAVKAPILLAAPGDVPALKRARERWERVKVRADYCLQHAPLGANAAQLAAARGRLTALELPWPTVDSALAGLLPKDPRAAWQIVVNPIRRARYFAGQDIALARAELDRMLGKDWRGYVASVRLTSSAAEARSFRAQVASELQRLQATVPGLAIDIGGGTSAVPAAEVVFAVADAAGRVRLLYSSRGGLFLALKAAMGSTAKMPAAVALSRVDQSNTPYCRAPIPGMNTPHSQDDVVCRAAGSWVAAKEAFARSDSPAIHWALRHHTKREQLEATASAFGLPPLGDVPVSTALSIGNLEASPAEMVRLAGAIGMVVSGELHDVPYPSIIAELWVLADNGDLHARAVATGEALHREHLVRVVPARAGPFVASMLEATSGPSGTLRILGPVKAALGGHLYAKTGTVSVAGITKVLQIAGIFRHHNQRWAFTLMIAGSDGSHPIGRNLAAGQFAPLVALALRHVARGAPGKNSPAPGGSGIGVAYAR